MDIAVSLDDEQVWAEVVIYAAWSIDAEFFGDREDDLLAWLHDGGTSVTADLTAAEADELRLRLGDLSPVLTLTELRQQRRQDRRQRRRERMRRLLDWS